MAFESYYKLVKYKNLNKIPFYVEDVSGSANTVSITKGDVFTPAITIETSTDKTTWTTLGTTSTSPLNIAVPANGKVYLRCDHAWGYADGLNGNIITATGDFKVSGNAMSLVYGSNFTGSETTFPDGMTDALSSVFRESTHLVDASDLILPATTLARACYAHMFRRSSITAAPVLPATTLARSCYHYMFGDCTSLTTVPTLPAPTLQSYCYTGMFSGCTSLTTAPTLIARNINQTNCYNYMFNGCTSLNSITCLATYIMSNTTTNWLNGVAANGTFTKAASMSSWTTGIDGIPSGWTVQDAQ